MKTREVSGKEKGGFLFLAFTAGLIFFINVSADFPHAPCNASPEDEEALCTCGGDEPSLVESDPSLDLRLYSPVHWEWAVVLSEVPLHDTPQVTQALDFWGFAPPLPEERPILLI
jgi:hypothetical protein